MSSWEGRSQNLHIYRLEDFIHDTAHSINPKFLHFNHKKNKIAEIIGKQIKEKNIYLYKQSIPVVLNRSSESHMQLPSTLCAALSALSRKPLIFCVTDFVPL